MLQYYTENSKVVAQTKNGTYSIKKRIYELENELITSGFVRISNSEIVNIDCIKKLEYKSG